MAQLKDLIVNGPSRFIGDVYATTFTGNLAGNANTATNATNAGMIAGLSVHSGRNNEANKIVRTDGNGYLQVGYINSSSGHEKNASNPTYVWGSNSSDSYLRSYQTSSLSVNYATSSGSCSGNAATATKAGCLDTGGMALYANHNNEINFGGTVTSSIIFFGYRATGSKPIPTSFVFGGSNGTASLTASGFKKNGSGASYVLTGDGGHAAISSLSVNYATSSGSCSGNAATATNASSAGNADKLDGVHYQNILERYYSGYSSSGTATGWFRIAETLITDDGGATFLLAIQRGYSYTNNESYLFSISVSFGGGISITQLSGYANTRLITKIRVDWTYRRIAYVDIYIGSSSKTNDYFWYTIGCAKSYTTWIANPTLVGRYPQEFTTVQGCKSDKGFTGYLTGTASSSSKWAYARTITLTGSVTGSVSIDGSGDVSLATTTNHTHNYLPLSGGTMSNTNKVTNLNADLLDGYHASSFSLTSHTHSYIVTQGDNRSTATKPSDYINRITFAGLKNNATVGKPSSTTYNYIVGLRGWSDTSGGKAHELAFNDNGIFHRIGATDTWETWAMMLTTSNFNSYSPKLDGTGAKGTWKISISGNAASATKLANSRTIWGQSFDGTGNVSGALSGVTNINSSLYINSSGNVGIGTTSPSYKLHVNGDGYFTDNVITESDFSSRGNAIIDGYVGIGTTSPAYKLDVAGTIHTTTDITANGHAKANSLKTQNICIECDDSGNTAGHTSEINNYSRPLYIQYSTSNNCCICYGGGNVGIGITSPTYKLHVSGDARIDGTISCIKLSQTSDIKYKTNIKQIEYEEALKIIENLNPVTWD